jgi:hypothetical protein
MSRPELGPIAEGDAVFVYQNSWSSTRRADSVISAQVVKVARVWIDIASFETRETPNGAVPVRTWRMRRDTQCETAGPNPVGARFVTPEQHLYNERLREARGFLRDQGITLKSESPWNSDERLVQLADLIGGVR